MVRRVLSLLTSDVSGVHGAAYILALSALLSQLLALVRDRLLAGTFGAGVELDVYYAAFRIQDFVFFSVASLVSLSVLIPFLVGKMEKGKDATRGFLDSMATVFFLAMVLVGTLGVLLVPYLVPRLFPGLIGQGFDNELLFLSKLLMLSPLLLGFSNLLASVTQAYRKYFIYALSPLLYNIGIIFGIVVFYPFYGLVGLGYGVVAGALLHLLVQVPFIWKEGLFPRLTFRINVLEAWQVALLSLPRTITLTLNHVALLFLTGMASLLSEGSISILSFSFNLGLVPVSIIGASYSVAAFPLLAKHFLRDEREHFIEHFSAALTHIVFWSFPAIALLVVLRAQIVRVILGTGSFSWSDTRLTAACLALLAISVIAQNISLLLVRAFYAGGDTKRPLVAALTSSFSIVVFAYLGLSYFKENSFFSDFLEALFRVTDVSGAEVLILPLAYTLGSFVNLFLLSLFFKRFLSISVPVGVSAFHSFAASIVMGFAAYKALEWGGRVFNLDTFNGIFMQGMLGALAGMFAWVLLLALLKNKQFLEIQEALRRRVFKTDVIQTDPVA